MSILIKVIIAVILTSITTIVIEKKYSGFATKYYTFMLTLPLKIFVALIIVICIVIILQNMFMI
jgi:hypothetical protein